jgi:hypothetical protein
MKILKLCLFCLAVVIIFISGVKPTLAFCGFYVAKADTSLYNQTSQVIIARNGKKTILTMSNDYQGDVKGFALVIPVPVVLKFEIPEFVKRKFGNFYQAIFETSYEERNKEVAFLEYAWDMGSCDPCAAEPLTPEELKQAGVFWLDRLSNNGLSTDNVFMTRLHIRYTRDKFPEDLFFQPTNARQSFQARYIIRHPYTGEIGADLKAEYEAKLAG